MESERDSARVQIRPKRDQKAFSDPGSARLENRAGGAGVHEALRQVLCQADHGLRQVFDHPGQQTGEVYGTLFVAEWKWDYKSMFSNV